MTFLTINLSGEALPHSLGFSAERGLGAFSGSPGDFLEGPQLNYDYILNLNKVVRYDTVILCDDSGSMQSYGRYDIMRNTILRISDVCTAFQDEGIAIRTQLDKVISSINPKGKRRLGIVLRNKIVKPLIIQKAKKKSLKRPVLVTLITGGQTIVEDRGELKRTILNCKRELAKLVGPRDELYGGRAVVFQISLVGSSSAARNYVTELEDDPEVGHLVYCTSERLDDVKGRMKDPRYTGWLIQLLAVGINNE